MNETPLQAAQRQRDELYKELRLVPPFSPRRISIQMQINRLRREIRRLEKAG
jgi:hypothetical protein